MTNHIQSMRVPADSTLYSVVDTTDPKPRSFLIFGTESAANACCTRLNNSTDSNKIYYRPYRVVTITSYTTLPTPIHKRRFFSFTRKGGLLFWRIGRLGGSLYITKRATR